jgi:hypothetical protein
MLIHAMQVHLERRLIVLASVTRKKHFKTVSNLRLQELIRGILQYWSMPRGGDAERQFQIRNYGNSSSRRLPDGGELVGWFHQLFRFSEFQIQHHMGMSIY